MATKAQGRKRGAHSVQAAAASRGRVAEAVQAAARAKPSGDSAQLEAGGAVLEAGRWFRRRCYLEDVCGQEQPGAGRVEFVCFLAFPDTLSSKWHGHGVGGKIGFLC